MDEDFELPDEEDDGLVCDCIVVKRLDWIDALWSGLVFLHGIAEAFANSFEYMMQSILGHERWRTGRAHFEDAARMEIEQITAPEG
jgi:hypothetical protein